MLCEADNTDYGAMWECPILVELNHISQHPGRQSEAAISELSKSFNNMDAFSERVNGDSAKSQSVIAANDPKDAALVSRKSCLWGFDC